MNALQVIECFELCRVAMTHKRTKSTIWRNFFVLFVSMTATSVTNIDSKFWVIQGHLKVRKNEM